MSKENIEKFYYLLSKNDDLKEYLVNESKNKENHKDFIKNFILPIAKDADLNFTEDEFMDYSKTLLKGKLSDEDMEKVSGGLWEFVLIPALILGSGVSVHHFWPFSSSSPKKEVQQNVKKLPDGKIEELNKDLEETYSNRVKKAANSLGVSIIQKAIDNKFKESKKSANDFREGFSREDKNELFTKTLPIINDEIQKYLIQSRYDSIFKIYVHKVKDTLRGQKNIDIEIGIVNKSGEIVKTDKILTERIIEKYLNELK